MRGRVFDREENKRKKKQKERIMEVGNYTQCLLQRIQKIEPQNATKIFGYLLLQYNVEEIMEYVSATEEQIHSLIAEAKTYFTLSPKINNFSHHLHPFHNHHISPPFSPPSAFRALSPRHIALNHHSPFQNSNIFHHNDSWEQNCKLFNGHVNPDIFNTMLGIGLKELSMEDHMPSPGSLEKLEMEISELLRVRRGMPVCLSLLPLLYQEMYGKTLQAEGYLTDSQRHGKVGFSLTKLLARLRSVRLVDRPHGQHCIVLAEDVPKFMKYMNESNDPGNSSSHQIYLTFPAESTFTDSDVQNYFNQFGPVHDVRIPHQEKRMFGFVSFYHAETVRQILGIGHPHNICGSRVLVKPYIEKSRLVQRKQAEKLNDEIYFSSLSFDMDSTLSPRQRSYETSQLHRNSRSLDESRFLEDRFSSLSIVLPENGDDATDKAWQPCSNFNDQDSPKIQLPESPFASPRYQSDGLNTAV